MNKLIKLFFILIFSLSIAIIADAQAPPHPNGGGEPGSGNTPVGGAAPIDGGFTLFLILSGGYAIKKNLGKNNNITKPFIK